MEQNTKIELAKAIIEKMLGEACVQEKEIQKKIENILETRRQVYHFNEQKIDELLNKYQSDRSKQDVE